MAYLSDIFQGNESGLHVGTLATFLKGKVPAGYLIPNGAEFSSLEYPELFTYLGSNKLPDLIDDESVPVGSIMPWISNSDIPNGWHHLGAQNAVEFTDARLYKFSEYPEFCNFINKARGVPLGQDALLEVLRFGETFRQVIRHVAHENHHDVTDVWDWQPDAIRRIAGEITCVTGDTGVILDKPSSTLRSFPVAGNIYNTGTQQNVLSTIISQQVAKDVRMTNRSVNYLIKVKPSKITKTTIAIKAAGRVSDEGLMQVEGIRKELDTFSHANLIINGDFSVWQRKGFRMATYENTNGNEYTADRWRCTLVQENVAHHPFRAGYYLDYAQTYYGSHMRVQATEGKSSRISYNYRIESSDIRGLFNQEVTLSFYFGAKNLANSGSLSVVIYSANSQDNFSAVTGRHHLPVVAALPLNSEMTRYDVTWVVGNEESVFGTQVEIVLMTDETGTIPLVTPSSEFRLGGVKLEKGSVTPFVPDDYATNLAKCQRYYEVLGVARHLAGADNKGALAVHSGFAVTKRTPPTVSIKAFNQFLATVPKGDTRTSLNLVSSNPSVSGIQILMEASPVLPPYQVGLIYMDVIADAEL
ncbi:phage tail protein [Photobacterium leiognathi]|uniref:phage tail protein n=1 Tax=Photobacterium leiognathi TaxID=553611 RepID=UPI0029814A25|nr:phage tail protein [Photobacterium leiognathi]